MPSKHQRIITAFALVTLSLSGCAGHTMIRPQPAPPPPTHEQLVGTWLAISSFSAHRLDLSTDGTATLLSGYGPRNELRQYATDRWELQDYELTAVFHPIHSDADPVYFRGSAERLYYSEAQLRNVSISLSADGLNPVGDFIRQTLLQEWLDVLAQPTVPQSTQ